MPTRAWARPNPNGIRESIITANPATFYNNAIDNNFATAPDRGDFGKWCDVTELYFGKYAAARLSQPGRQRQLSQRRRLVRLRLDDPGCRGSVEVFGYYADFWFEKDRSSGHQLIQRRARITKGSTVCAAISDRGCRRSFGNISSITPARKNGTSFSWRRRSTAGAGLSIESAFRHPEREHGIQLHPAHVNNSSDISYALESRRSAYSGGEILFNLTSHDEVMPDNDGWVTASRYAALS